VGDRTNNPQLVKQRIARSDGSTMEFRLRFI
jgi:hypothetical protein